MNRLPIGWLAITFASLCFAQDPATPQPANTAGDPLAGSKAKLRTALEKTAAFTDVAYSAKWAEDSKKKADANVFVFGSPSEGALAGTCHQVLRTCKFEGDNGDELVVAGARTIAKDANTGWTLRAGRFADGNSIDFLPDPALLLDQLAAWDLAVVHREVGSLDDRPVEIVTVTLSAAQTAQAVYAGLIPDSLAANAGFGGMVFQMGGAGNAGPRAAPPAPDATVDLAITFDPSTSLVQQVQFRSWMKQDGGGRVIRGAGGAIAVRAVAGFQVGGQGGQEEEEEEEKPDATKPAQPMQYEGGLPVRPRKKTTVVDYTVRLREHGTAKAPGLTDEQKKLLRL